MMDKNNKDVRVLKKEENENSNENISSNKRNKFKK